MWCEAGPEPFGIDIVIGILRYMALLLRLEKLSILETCLFLQLIGTRSKFRTQPYIQSCKPKRGYKEKHQQSTLRLIDDLLIAQVRCQHLSPSAESPTSLMDPLFPHHSCAGEYLTHPPKNVNPLPSKSINLPEIHYPSTTFSAAMPHSSILSTKTSNPRTSSSPTITPPSSPPAPPSLSF